MHMPSYTNAWIHCIFHSGSYMKLGINVTHQINRPIQSRDCWTNSIVPSITIVTSASRRQARTISYYLYSKPLDRSNNRIRQLRTSNQPSNSITFRPINPIQFNLIRTATATATATASSNGNWIPLTRKTILSQRIRQSNKKYKFINR